jgi:hypothetical protein
VDEGIEVTHRHYALGLRAKQQGDDEQHRTGAGADHHSDTKTDTGAKQVRIGTTKPPAP